MIQRADKLEKLKPEDGYKFVIYVERKYYNYQFPSGCMVEETGDGYKILEFNTIEQTLEFFNGCYMRYNQQFEIVNKYNRLEIVAVEESERITLKHGQYGIDRFYIRAKKI